MKSHRREFLKQTGSGLAAAVGSAAAPALATSGRRAATTVSLGVIGCRGQGYSNLRSLLKLPEAECRALCDVDRGVLEERAAQVEGQTGSGPRLYGDYRRLLEDRDIDAVVIATPDHWHCRMLVDSLEAGKHVFVEKPLANSIQECDLMLKAARRHPRLAVQVGQWQRSGPHWQRAIEFVHSGRLGRVRTVKAWAYQGWMKPVPVLPDEPVPDGVDYDMWLGPAPRRPFNRNRFHFNFRWFWDYAGGLMTDWGVHVIDFALSGMSAGYPHSVAASGGKFAYPDDASETPDTLQALYEFDGFTLVWEHATGIDLGPYRKNHGVAFIGNRGTLVVNREGWEVIAEEERDPGTRQPVPLLQVPAPESHRGDDLDRHTRNFVAAIDSGERLNAGIGVGHLAAVVAHMGNIAFRTGRRVVWDGPSHAFRDDPEANRLMRVDYRSPWTLPS